VKAVIHAESHFDPKARSHKGAVGLMQLMPRTARMYGVRRLTDPRENIRAGVQHLKKLLGRHEDLSHVIAAYNAGSPTVRRYRGIPPFRETRTYVTRVLRYRGLYLEDPLYAPVAAPAPLQRKPVFGTREDIGTRG
jgi:soluble lytic murein transglycosylase-like protein